MKFARFTGVSAAMLAGLTVATVQAHPHTVGSPVAESAHLHAEPAIGLALLCAAIGAGLWRRARVRAARARQHGE